MRNAPSCAALIAVLLVAFAAKYERAMVNAASTQAAAAVTENAQQPAAAMLLAQLSPCPNGACIR